MFRSNEMNVFFNAAASKVFATNENETGGAYTRLDAALSVAAAAAFRFIKTKTFFIRETINLSF